MKLLILGAGSNFQIPPMADLYLQQIKAHTEKLGNDTDKSDIETLHDLGDLVIIHHSGNLEFVQKNAEKYGERVDELTQLAEMILSPMGQDVWEVTKFDYVPQSHDVALIDPKQNHRPWEESKKELLRRRSRNLSRKLAHKNGRKKK